METDRGCVLTVRAASRGLIDFRQARVLDVRWWRMVNAVLTAMAKEDELETYRLAYQFQLALVGNPRLSPETFAEVQKKAQGYFKDAFCLLKPWAAGALGDGSGGADDLVEVYRRHVGDPRDPEFMRKLEADLAASRARREARRQRRESEDERIDRLVRERDARERAARTRRAR